MKDVATYAGKIHRVKGISKISSFVYLVILCFQFDGLYFSNRKGEALRLNM